MRKREKINIACCGHYKFTAIHSTFFINPEKKQKPGKTMASASAGVFSFSFPGALLPPDDGF